MPISVFATRTLPSRSTSYASGLVHRRISFLPSGETAFAAVPSQFVRQQQPEASTAAAAIQVIFIMLSFLLVKSRSAQADQIKSRHYIMKHREGEARSNAARQR